MLGRRCVGRRAANGHQTAAAFELGNQLPAIVVPVLDARLHQCTFERLAPALDNGQRDHGHGHA